LKIAIALIPVQKKEFAVIVSKTTEKGVNCLPVTSLTTLKNHTTEA
jgi:hypothetical protein